MKDVVKFVTLAKKWLSIANKIKGYISFLIHVWLFINKINDVLEFIQNFG